MRQEGEEEKDLYGWQFLDPMRSLFSRFRNRDRGEKVRKTRKSTAKMNGLLAREVLKKNNASKVSTFYVSSSKIYRKGYLTVKRMDD